MPQVSRWDIWNEQGEPVLLLCAVHGSAAGHACVRSVGVEPTRGLNKPTGTERIGADVRKERQNEQMAEALKPIFGETAEQLVKRHHRATLTPDARHRCGRLDEQLAAAQDREARAAGSALAAVQRQLLDLRNQH